MLAFANRPFRERAEVFEETAARLGMGRAAIGRIYPAGRPPRVRSARGDDAGSIRAVSPFATQVFPDLFVAPRTVVWALGAERTFWEKVTILHAAAHKMKNCSARWQRTMWPWKRLRQTLAGTSGVVWLGVFPMCPTIHHATTALN